MQFFQQKVAEHFDYYFEFINDKSQKKVNELLGAAARVNELLRKDTARTSKKDIYGSPDFLIIKMLRIIMSITGRLVVNLRCWIRLLQISCDLPWVFSAWSL